MRMWNIVLLKNSAKYHFVLQASSKICLTKKSFTKFWRYRAMNHHRILSATSVVALLFTSAISMNAHAKICQQPQLAKTDSLRNETTLRPIDGCQIDPPDEPYRAPSVPTTITYAPYTNQNSLTVQWSASNGFNFPVAYELYESVNNGAYNLVYSGSGRQVTLNGRIKSKVTYKVLAKNSLYSSTFRQGPAAILNPVENKPNLYQKYPVLSALDQITDSNHATAPRFKTVIARDGNTARNSATARQQGLTDSVLYLGEGYDLVRAALKETCLNPTNPGFQITISPPLLPSVFDVQSINDNIHLAEVLDVSYSATVGIVGNDFNAGFSGEKARYFKSVTDNTHIRVAVKVKRRNKFARLNTPTDAIYSELVSQVLSPNSNEAKADFRERCGDNFINTVNVGTALYLVFDMDAKQYSSTERETKKGEFGLKISTYFSIGGSGSSSSEFEQFLKSNHITIHADQVGGPVGIAAGITESNVLDKYNEFVRDTDENNWAVVDFTTNDYQRPTAYNAYTHAQIFADYKGTQGPLAQMKRWLDLGVQNKERCDAWAGYGQLVPDACRAAQTELSIAMGDLRTP
jgi:hypothetical protein